MKEIPEPLMFIHTVTTKKADGKVQDYYDSVEPHDKKIKQTLPETSFDEKKDLENFDIQEKVTELEQVVLESPIPIKDMLSIKINNIIKMYNNGRPVESIILTNDEEINCIPYAIENEEILAKVEEEEKRIKLSDIQDIYIVKF